MTTSGASQPAVASVLPTSSGELRDEKAVEPTSSAVVEAPSADSDKQEPSGVNDEKPKGNAKSSDEPEGGFDATPIPKRPSGYTLKFTIHRAENLPIADLNAMSSDPYVLAELTADTPTRHKEDPPLRFRTPTIHRQTEPEWNEEWIVANVPASGFKLKLRIYDEDPADQDDRLGNVHIHVPSISDTWAGMKEAKFDVKKRSGSKRAYLLRMITTCFRISKQLHGEIIVSIEMIGRTEDDGQNGRLYTVGPCRWIRHYSPMLGRLAGIKEAVDDDDDNQQAPAKKKIEKYNFQANEMQLQGPVPAELYHRFVEFKPFVKRMFTASGLGGMILSKALHHQHSRVYNFSRDTLWGYFSQGPCPEMTQQFLDLVRYDRGGRIFTYIISLDALFRFTETGKEFGVDMLSKHTMHSDVSVYIAFSGEFFIRRLKKSSQGTNEGEGAQGGEIAQTSKTQSDDPPKDPSNYELIIDNDSGTYRPNAEKLPLLKEFLSRSFPGLKVTTLDCQGDEKRMSRLKDEQRERKKREGDNIIVAQGSPRSSISSSDEENFDRMQALYENPDSDNTRHARGVLGQTAKDQKQKQSARWDRVKRDALHRGRNEEEATMDADQAAPEGRS